MGRAHHPEPGVGDGVDIRGIVVERVRPLDGEQPGRDAGSRRAVGVVRGEIGRGPDDPEPAVGARREPIGPRGHVKRAGQEPPPRRRWPAERDREQDHVVAPIVVSVEVEVPGRLRRSRQDLQRDVALDEPRHVDVPAGAALHQVAAPEQRIRVRSATHSSAWRALARSDATYGGSAAVVHSRASVRPTAHRPPAFAVRVSAAAVAVAIAAARRDPNRGRHVWSRGRSSRSTISSSTIRPVGRNPYRS
jgi:hypothetical protein